MICSSTTTSPPERRRGRAIAVAALLVAALAGPGAAALPGNDDITKAREALVQNDGIAAEVRLREALAVGAPREGVAAYMGEVLPDQDAPETAQ